MVATITKPEELTDRQCALITGAMENRGRLLIAVPLETLRSRHRLLAVP